MSDRKPDGPVAWTTTDGCGMPNGPVRWGDVTRLPVQQQFALYLRPQPVLTAAEREALHHVVGDVSDITGPVEDAIRGLLERAKDEDTQEGER